MKNFHIYGKIDGVEFHKEITIEGSGLSFLRMQLASAIKDSKCLWWADGDGNEFCINFSNTKVVDIYTKEI